MNNYRLSILGLGLIGSTVAMAGRKHLSHLKITGYDASNAVRNEARRRGVVDVAATSVERCVNGADLIVIATPLGAAQKLFRQIATSLTDMTVVTDVCSTKRSIVRLAASMLPNRGAAFVGSHPMFGSERSGIAAADVSLVAGSRCIVTPTARTSPAAVRLVRAFWTSIGMQPTVMTAAEHDLLMARASHLPQVVASMLMARQTADSMKLSGRGLSDTTRLAGSNPQLWAEILIDNADNISRELAAVAKSLTQLAGAAKEADRKSLINQLQAGRAAREQLNKLVGRG